MKNTLFTKLVSAYVSLTMVLTPMLASMNAVKAIAFFTSTSSFMYTVDALADQFSDNALAGQSQGKSLVKGFKQPTVNQSTGDITINNLSAPVTITRDQMFQPSADSADPSVNYGSDSLMNSTTGTTITKLNDPNNGSGLSNAYKTLIGAHANKADLKQNDPIATQARSVFSDQNGDISSIIAGCSSTTTTTGSTSLSELSPDLRACQFLAGASDVCDIKHNLILDPNVVEWASGPTNVSSCGPGCLDIWIGYQGDNYWGGYCTIYEAAMSLTVHQPDAIISAKIDYATYDDYMQIYVGKSKVYNGPNGNFPPETGGACELSTSWVVNPNVDVTSNFKSTVPNSNLDFKIRVSVAGNGEGYAHMHLQYDPKKTIVKDEWTVSPACDSVIQSIKDDKVCHGNVTCQSLDVNNCTTLNGQKVCVGDPFSSSIAPTPSVLNGYNIPNICTKININKTCSGCLPGAVNCDAATSLDTCAQDRADCRVVRSDCIPGMSATDGSNCYGFKETYDCNKTLSHSPIYHNCTVVPSASAMLTSTINCTKDANGIETCAPVNFKTPSNSCASYEKNKQCKLVYSDCPSTFKDPVTGQCQALQKTYDCGFPFDQNSTGTTQAQCSGSTIRCTGSDCLQLPTETSNDFGPVAANANIINYSQQDSGCVQNASCEFFKGKEFRCKSGFFGVVDCCSSPDNVTPFQYLELMHNTWSLTQDTELGETLASTGSDIAGSISSFTSPATTALSDVISPLTTPFDELASNIGSSLLQPGSNWLNIAPELTNSMQSFVSSTFGDAVSSQIFDVTNGLDVANGMAPDYALNVTNFMQSLQPLMTAYMYFQIAIILIQIIWSCDDSELELGAKKAMKLCHYIGDYCDQEVLGICVITKETYCCFNSPFGRIMQEQIRPQLGISWGGPESPNCSGMTIADLTSADFSKVDLGEWISMLDVSGLQTTSMTNAATKFSIDNITQYNKKNDTLHQNVYDRIQNGVGNPTVNLPAAADQVKSGL